MSEQQARRVADKAQEQEAEQRRAAEMARAQESRQRHEAVVAREAAEQLSIRAEAERQRAEANFAQARRAVDEYLNQVTRSELLTMPGLQPLRHNLLTSALRFL